jgi:hypothetical protein
MKRILIVFILISAAMAACAQPGIPTPPGATVTTEVNVDREQIVTQINSILSMQGGKMPQLSEAQLELALGTLQRAQYSQMELSAKYSAVDLLALFEKHVDGRRIVWSTEGKPGSGYVLLATDDGGYFGAALSPTISKDGHLTGCKINAFRTVGFVDITGVIKLAVPMLKDMGIAAPKFPIHK